MPEPEAYEQTDGAPPSSRRHMALTIIAVLVALLASACGGGESKGPPSRLVNPGAFATAVAEPARITINVHVPFAGSIAGTDRFIPYNQIARSSRLPADRSTPLAVYCRSGRMSAIAVKELARLGYRNVVELRGGMDAWTAQGRALDMTAPKG